MAAITLYGVNRHIVTEYSGYLIFECYRSCSKIWYEAIHSNSDMEDISRYGFDSTEDLKNFIDKTNNKSS